ncbi:MAG: hypothetical protein ACOYB3_00705 [Azonexus sp.]
MIPAIDTWKAVVVPRGFVLRMAGMGFRPTDDDITGDIDRLIRAVVGQHTDHSNVNLHFDEMYGELMLKLAQLLNRQDLFFDDRKKFFGFLKVALTRHKNTLIQRYAFTMKRTGVKPKDQEDTVDHAQLDEPVLRNPHDDDPHKPVNISLDDDEHGIANFFGVESGREAIESAEILNKFIDTHLTPVEAIVIRQEMEPNDASYVYAYVEHNDGGKANGKFKIRDLHKAQGIGLELNAYKKVMARVKVKMEPLFKGKKIMNEQNDLQQIRFAELQLCEIFNIQVPAHVDPIIKRRAFTIAARDNYDKVNSDVASLLEQVGAYVPKKHGDTMACFGVLWESNHRSCTLCALEESCKTAAAQVGLDQPDFKLDKRLLGTKATKTPMILPKIEPPQDGEKPVRVASLTVLTTTDRDEEVMSFLNETMEPTLHEGEIFYRLPDKARRRIFCVGQPERLMQLRFCNPSDKLRSELIGLGKGPAWTVPDDMELSDVKTLMNEHIADQLK